MLGGPGEDLADLDPALTILLEPERRRQRGPGLTLGRQVPQRERLAFILVQKRLGVKRIDLRRPTVEIDVDDVLGLGGEVRRPRCQRITHWHTATHDIRALGNLPQIARITEQAEESEHPHARAYLAEGLTPCRPSERVVVHVGLKSVVSS